MKFLYLIFLFALLWSFSIFGQDKKFSYGLVLAPDYTAEYFVFLGRNPSPSKVYLGYMFGGNLFQKLSKRAYFSTGLNFVKNGYEEDIRIRVQQDIWNGVDKYKYFNLSIPILIYHQWGQYNKQKMSFLISYGANIEWAIKARNIRTVPTNSIYNYDFSYSSLRQKTPERISINLGMGWGYELSKKHKLIIEPYLKIDIVSGDYVGVGIKNMLVFGL